MAVPESLAGSVQLGQAVEVRVDANERVLTGTVGEVSPQVDAAARAFVVKVDLPSDALEGLSAGMFARVHFPRQARDQLTVPPEAVSARGPPDRVLALACDYMCAWAGFEEVDGFPMWITGLRRG